MKQPEFKIIPPEEINDNVFKLIGKDWMFVTAGTPEKYNCMTASWGGMGILWQKPVVFVFIRPTRYTFEFSEKSLRMSLCFFSEKYRPLLNLCGTKSGRDMEKMKIEGLTPAFSREGVPFYNEARIAVFVKKLYSQFLDKNLVMEQSVHELYSGDDYHKMYICEIEKIMLQK
jgi:flavin reductase (DIM6/NTAB) family NADH-FMN oxidoreductase RutF